MISEDDSLTGNVTQAPREIGDEVGVQKTHPSSAAKSHPSSTPFEKGFNDDDDDDALFSTDKATSDKKTLKVSEESNSIAKTFVDDDSQLRSKSEGSAKQSKSSSGYSDLFSGVSNDADDIFNITSSGNGRNEKPVKTVEKGRVEDRVEDREDFLPPVLKEATDEKATNEDIKIENNLEEDELFASADRFDKKARTTDKEESKVKKKKEKSGFFNEVIILLDLLL